MANDREMIPRIKVACIWEEVEEEGKKYIKVVQRAQRREVFLTFPTTEIWALIDEGCTIGKIIDDMKLRGVGEEDVLSILENLYDLGLIENPEYLWKKSQNTKDTE